MAAEYTYHVDGEDFLFRPIEPKDNPVIAGVIRRAFEEFGIAKVNTLYDSPKTDAMYSVFQQKGAAYWVVEWRGEVCAGCGFFPTDGLPDGMAEVERLYSLPAVRGKGVASALLTFVERQAKLAGYSSLYLETTHRFFNAVVLYRRLGYQHLTAPLGNCGYSRTTVFMKKDLI